MRRRYAIVAAIATWLTQSNLDTQRAFAEPSFPYTAYTTQDAIAVRSGPGDDFYETDRLDWGSKVEVYRHDEGQWCAIRPPAHSFSWVAAEHVKLTDDRGLGRITDSAVRTRVGSRFDDTHDVEYISLRRGEVVEVLGMRALQEPSGAEEKKWFKIAPPAGEFRWVHRSHLSRQPPGNGSTAAPAVDGSLAEADESTPVERVAQTEPTKSNVSQQSHVQVAPSSHLQQTGFAEVSESGTEISAGSAGGEISYDTATDKPVSASLWRDVGSSTEPLAEQPEPLAEQSETLVEQSDSTAENAASFEDRLAAVNLHLSQTVIQDVGLWDLQPLRARVQHLMLSAENDEQVASAQSLVRKITDFEQVQVRHQTLLPANSLGEAVSSKLEEPEKLPNLDSDSPSIPLLDDASVVGTASVPRPAAAARRQNRATIPARGSTIGANGAAMRGAAGFDATGWLVPVRSKREGIPPYALTDSKGRVLHFVSLQTGLDVDRYLHREVGISGQRGYLRQLRKPHLTAAQVIPLQR